MATLHPGWIGLGLFCLFVLLWTLGFFNKPHASISEKPDIIVKSKLQLESEAAADAATAAAEAAKKEAHRVGIASIKANERASSAAVLVKALRTSLGLLRPGTGATGGVTLPGSISSTTNPITPTLVNSLVSPNLSNTPVLTEVILFTKERVGNDTFYIAEIVVRVIENDNIRTLTKDDYSSAICDDGANIGHCRDYPASNAIDGNKNNYVHTGRTSSKLMFILKDAKKVVDVTVFSRTDFGTNTLVGVTLTLLSSNNTLVKECMLNDSASYVCVP